MTTCYVCVCARWKRLITEATGKTQTGQEHQAYHHQKHMSAGSDKLPSSITCAGGSWSSLEEILNPQLPDKVRLQGHPASHSQQWGWLQTILATSMTCTYRNEWPKLHNSEVKNVLAQRPHSPHHMLAKQWNASQYSQMQPIHQYSMSLPMPKFSTCSSKTLQLRILLHWECHHMHASRCARKTMLMMSLTYPWHLLSPEGSIGDSRWIGLQSWIQSWIQTCSNTAKICKTEGWKPQALISMEPESSSPTTKNDTQAKNETLGSDHANHSWLQV